MSVPKTIEALEGARFMMEEEEGIKVYFTTHVVAKETEHASVLMSFSENNREDEAAELDVFLAELVQGRYLPL